MSKHRPSVGYDDPSVEHPTDTQAVQELVRRASLAGRPVRVIGSMHSEDGSVLSERPDAICVMTDKLQKVHIDSSAQPRAIVTVGAGVSLGGDPLAPQPNGQARGNPQSDPSKSLFHQLHNTAPGWALPITGGISHQTISGFLATGADGGSTRHSFARAVQSITWVNGLADVVTSHRDPQLSSPGAAPLQAALASLGLFGIVTEVVLEIEPTFDIGGQRSVQLVRSADVRVVEPWTPGEGGDPPRTLRTFLESKEYARALWWPEPGVERIELWEAHRLDENAPEQDFPQRGLPDQESGVPSPLLQVAGNALLRFIAKLNENEPEEKAMLDAMAAAPGDKGEQGILDKLNWRVLRRLLKDLRERLTDKRPPVILRGSPGPEPTLESEFPNPSLKERVIAGIIDLFVRLSPAATATWHDELLWPRRTCGALFRDHWHIGLPMDNPMDDTLFPVTFTEVWLPLELAQEALEALHNEFVAKRLQATGTFAIELYAAKASDSWLSPAYKRDVLRVDPFWCDNDDEQGRQAYFRVFWDTLARPEFKARLHWGKALPADYDASSTTNGWEPYPKLNDFLQERRKQDPHGLFLTEYWRRHLGITDPVIGPTPTTATNTRTSTTKSP